MNNKRITGLIGFPLSHSFSKAFFSEKFINEKIDDCQYLNFEIEKIDNIRDVISENPDLIGLNVTIPYKQSVIELLDELSEDAKEIGAVNTICIDRSSGETRMVGYNTDHIGFTKTLEMILDRNPPGALILGTGGASKAVEYSLNKIQVPHFYISRNPSGNMLAYSNIDEELLTAFPLIINTTPLGMYPAIDTKPAIPYDLLGPEHYLIDLVYNPEKTLFLELGEKTGAKAINGLPMLKAQAEASWDIWQNL